MFVVYSLKLLLLSIQVRVATVVDVTGRRLQLSYDDGNGEEGN